MGRSVHPNYSLIWDDSYTSCGGLRAAGRRSYSLLCNEWHHINNVDELGNYAATQLHQLPLLTTIQDVDSAFSSPVWARERCRISPPRFLAECCKRQLNHSSFVLLYFRLFTFLICIEFVYLYFPVLFCLSVSVKWLAVKTASEMTYIVSSGVLNSTPTNQSEFSLNRSVLNFCYARSQRRRPKSHLCRTIPRPAVNESSFGHQGRYTKRPTIHWICQSQCFTRNGHSEPHTTTSLDVCVNVGVYLRPNLGLFTPYLRRRFYWCTL